jgi:hypothetical protein
LFLKKEDFMLCSKFTRVAVVAAALWAPSSFGSEVSFLSGVVRTENRTVASADRGKKTELTFGGRYADTLDKNLFWYGQGNLSLRSFSKGADGLAPDNSTSLSAGGGLRYYFGKLSEHFATFVYGGGDFRLDKDGLIDGTGRAVSNEKNGLYYGSSFGIRLYLGSDFFCDFETPLFESALFATEKTRTETRNPASGEVTSVEDKTSRTELFASSTGVLNTVKVAMGFRF